MDSVPLVDLLPVHAPLAVQLVAFVEDHARVEEPPLVTLLGVAVKVTVGAATTVTVADWLLLPPVPVQVRV